jgi:uncharacterized membrane protein YhaH (DUF805 family)
MFCANCGSDTTEANDLCAPCELEQLVLVPVPAVPMMPTAEAVATNASGNASNAAVLPGWFLDPLDASRQRYWDGAAWAAGSHAANSSPNPPGTAPVALLALKGMSLLDAVKSCMTKYVRFSGRARRSEYWWFGLFFTITYIVGDFVLPLVGDIGQVFGVLLVLSFFLPMIAVTVRRLHDTDRSGWFCLISFIPLAGDIIVLVVTCQDSSQGPNRYGPSPKYV